MRDTICTLWKWSEATKEPRPRAWHNQSQLLLRHTRSFENSRAFEMEKEKTQSINDILYCVCI